MIKRHISKVKGGYSNTLRKLSFTTSEFIKCPVNIGETLKWNSGKKVWKDFKLYCKYLDLKVQNPNAGTFQIFHSHRYYQRTIKQLIAKGWATRKGNQVYLKAYQYVWRNLDINRINQKGILRFKYWKIPVTHFSTERRIHDKEKKMITGYLKEIEQEIQKRISKRKLAQIRKALKEKGDFTSRATFSAKSASTTFGYKSTSTGSKLRQKYFEVLPMTPEECKQRFNKKTGRYEEPTKQIAV